MAAGGVASVVDGELERELERELEPVVVGETAAGQAGSTQAAGAGDVAAGHLGVHRCRWAAALALALVGRDRERASPVGSSPLRRRQERSASKKELGANLSASKGSSLGGRWARCKKLREVQ